MEIVSSSPLFVTPIPIRTLTRTRVRCCNQNPNSVHSNQPESESPSQDSKKSNTAARLLQLSVTLTVIHSSLSVPHAGARVSSKKQRAFSIEELKSWTEGLPTVSDRISYTELIQLKKQDKLKHIIKLSSSALRTQAEPVLVVLEDSRVFKSTLPSIERDREFWASWDSLCLESVCVNAYTPPVKDLGLPKPYLGWLGKIPMILLQSLGPKKKSKKALEFERVRAELVVRRRAEAVRARAEMEEIEEAVKAQKKAEARKKRLEERRLKFKESLRKAEMDSLLMSKIWTQLATDDNVTTVVGIIIFYIFYRTVVLNYKKQQKDYEDRLKIEKADAEERRKMKAMDMGMEGGEGEEGEDGNGEEKNAYLKMAMQFMRSGAKVTRANKKSPQYLEKGATVKFSDVAGLGKIKVELEEIVKFFTMAEVYKRRGVKIPGGILLCGPPGVGKTLLAKAVAGEAGVNFFSISASQFVEIYAGVGASRVRSLYEEARENAPAVVFIDELDAVGRKRGLIKGSGGQERDATLNQLLVCLDGFEGRGNVITIAATNRPDILDEALVRPGRFDRKIRIPKPSFAGRVEILKVHARKKKVVDDIDYEAIASLTDGMVGAELANIIEIAALSVMRDGRTEITTDDMLQAAQTEERGILYNRERSSDMWARLALNEVSGSVVAANFPELLSIEFMTIAPRAGRDMGYVRAKVNYLKLTQGMFSRKSFLDYITIQIAPRAADEIWFGEDQLSTIWAESANNARIAARRFVLAGLSDMHLGLSDFWLKDHIKEIDTEALRILTECYERAKKILRRNKVLVDNMVHELAQKKSLSKEEFRDLVRRYGQLEPTGPTIIEIRNSKLKVFRDLMMTINKDSASKNVT